MSILRAYRTGSKSFSRFGNTSPHGFFDEFDRLEEVFPAASYQYVLYGMGFETQVGLEDHGRYGAASPPKCSKTNERMKGEMQRRSAEEPASC